MFQNKTTLRDTANNFRCLLTITDYRIFTGGGDEDISVRKKETILSDFQKIRYKILLSCILMLHLIRDLTAAVF